MGISETGIENVALEWLAGMGYTILPGPSIAPGELTAERSQYDVVVLTGRLREALVNINPDLPESAIAEAIRAVCRVKRPSLLRYATSRGPDCCLGTHCCLNSKRMEYAYDHAY